MSASSLLFCSSPPHCDARLEIHLLKPFDVFHYSVKVNELGIGKQESDCELKIVIAVAGYLAYYLKLQEIDAIYIPIPINFIFVGFDGEGNHGNFLGLMVEHLKLHASWVCCLVISSNALV